MLHSSQAPWHFPICPSISSMISLWLIGMVAAFLLNLVFRTGHHWEEPRSSAEMRTTPRYAATDEKGRSGSRRNVKTDKINLYNVPSVPGFQGSKVPGFQ